MELAEDLPAARPAATVVVFRHGADGGPPQILLLERSGTMAFAGGATVFPGGAVDQADRELAAGTPGAQALEPDDAAARVAGRDPDIALGLELEAAAHMREAGLEEFADGRIGHRLRRAGRRSSGLCRRRGGRRGVPSPTKAGGGGAALGDAPPRRAAAAEQEVVFIDLAWALDVVRGLAIQDRTPWIDFFDTVRPGPAPFGAPRRSRPYPGPPPCARWHASRRHPSAGPRSGSCPFPAVLRGNETCESSNCRARV